MNLSFQQALVFLLRSSGVGAGQISWGSTASLDSPGSPYYNEVPEPPTAIPFVVLLIPDSSKDETFSDTYIETYRPEIHVVGVEVNVMDLGSPTSDFSVISFLDSYAATPAEINGNRFECAHFLRKDWRLDRDQTREKSPDGQRVWVASAKYEAIVTVQYPTRPR